MTRAARLAWILALGAALAACGDPATPAGPAADADGKEPFGPPRVQRTRDLDATPEFEYLAHGSGPALKAGDVVVCRYETSLADGGKVIDTTKDLGEPFVFEVGAGHLIRGWEKLATELRVGDHVRATIPSDLAYGDTGLESIVPPAADLVLDLEIESVAPPVSWEVVRAGDGETVRPGSMVTLHYVGTLPDGTEFDSSRRNDAKPYRFQAGTGAELEGFDAVVLKMRVGDRWKVKVPWPFAYGARGDPPRVPPQTDLVFDVEVLEVEPPDGPSEGQPDGQTPK